MKKVMYFFSLVLVVVSCRSVYEPEAGRFYIANDIESGLMPVSDFGNDVKMVQILTSNYNGKENTVDSIVKINNQEMLIIGMSDAVRLFTIRYNDDGVVADFSPLMGFKKIRPEYIVSDIQLIYYPLKAIQKNLPKNMTVVDVQDKKMLRREIFYGSEKIVHIKYLDKDIFKADVELDNLERGYSYRIRNNNE